MTGIQYVILAYSLALALLGGYAFSLLIHSRRLAAQQRDLTAGHTDDS